MPTRRNPLFEQNATIEFRFSLSMAISHEAFSM